MSRLRKYTENYKKFNLKQCGGSSLQVTVKCILVDYQVDAERLSPITEKYLKAAVLSCSHSIEKKGSNQFLHTLI